MKEIIFNGDNVLIHDFPDEIDIIYPPEPISPSQRPQETVRSVIEDLEINLKKDSKIVIAFDDISVPLPLPKEDPRRIMVIEVLKKLKKAGVWRDKIKMICATGLHRKCTQKELNFLLGNITSTFSVMNHDCRDVVLLGETERGHIVEINRVVAESDALIYLSVPFLPMNGGWKSIAVGLGSYECIRQHHIPEVLENSSYMNPHSEMHKIINEIGKYVAERISVIHVDVVVNNDFYSGFVSKAWRKFKGRDNLKQRLLLSISNSMPLAIKSAIRNRYRAGYEVAFATAGEVEEISSEVLKEIYRHRGLKVGKKYDALIFGLPNMCPYNVNSELNPILFHTMVRGYLCNMFESMLKKKAIFVVQNPVREFFDDLQHPAYRKFYYNYMVKGKTNAEELEKAEKELINDSKLMESYKTGFAYYPAHAVIAYYWGVLGMKRLEKVIVVGGNSEALKPLGFESAENMNKAIKMLKELGCHDVAYISVPPVFFAY